MGFVDNTETLDYLDIPAEITIHSHKRTSPRLMGRRSWSRTTGTINIRAQTGLDRRYPIRLGRNLAEISTTESIDETITRLHVSGYGGATFEEINGGKDYIDSPNIGHYHMPLEGRVEFSG